MKHGRDDYAAIQDVGALLEAGVLTFGPNASQDDRDRLSRPPTSIEPDEPVWLLRSRDVAAASTVAFWRERIAAYDADPRFLEQVIPFIEEMAEWGRLNGQKPPDAPMEIPELTRPLRPEEVEALARPVQPDPRGRRALPGTIVPPELAAGPPQVAAPDAGNPTQPDGSMP